MFVINGRAKPDWKSVSVMFCIGYTQTLFEALNEDISGIVDFYEV